MKSNRELGYERICRVDDYEVGRKGNRFRAYGYEWDSDQDASRERSHHQVCGRGDTPEQAVERMIEAAIAIAPHEECVHNIQRVTGLDRAAAESLRLELLEALAEAAEKSE